MSRSEPTPRDGPDSDDAGLIVRLQKGDREAFELISKQYSAELERFCVRLLGNGQNAREAVQMVFVRALSRAAEALPIRNPQAWLYRVARNICRDFFRAKGRQPEFISEITGTDGERRSAVEDLPDKLDRIVIAEIGADLELAFDELTADEQAYLKLRYFVGLSDWEIAKVMKKLPGPIAHIRRSALAKLRGSDLLKGYDTAKD